MFLLISLAEQYTDSTGISQPMLILTMGKCHKALGLDNDLSYSLAGAPSTVLRFKVGLDLELIPTMTISSGKSSMPEKLWCMPKGLRHPLGLRNEVVPLFSNSQNTKFVCWLSL
jgi:hypothetical protein